jgi:hypothetical protein
MGGPDVFFHGDFDWVANVFEETVKRADKPVKCLECFNRIPAGTEYKHVYLQQHEYCQKCQCEDGDDLEPCEDDEDHDFGETDEHRICESCQKLLCAIQHVESEDGCVGQETQPGLGELREAMWESDHAVEYIERARRDYPELAMSGHLDQFYELTREWRDEFEERWDWDDVGPVDEMGGEG